MNLPNGDRAIVEIEKLRDYSLSSTHVDGKHKARVFAAAAGLSSKDAELLRAKLYEAASQRECVLGIKTAHGQRYILDFELSANGRQAAIRSVWIVRTGEEIPRLVTCYVI